MPANTQSSMVPVNASLLPVGKLDHSADTFFFEPNNLGIGSSCQEPCTRFLRSCASRGLRGDECRAFSAAIIDARCDEL